MFSEKRNAPRWPDEKAYAFSRGEAECSALARGKRMPSEKGGGRLRIGPGGSVCLLRRKGNATLALGKRIYSEKEADAPLARGEAYIF